MLDLDRTAESRELIAAFVHSSRIRIDTVAATRRQVEAAVAGSEVLLTAFAIVREREIGTLAIGLLISTLCTTQPQAFASDFFVLNPMFILSGFSFPIPGMPQVLQWLTLPYPLHCYLVIIRGTFLNGVGLDVLWPQMAALAPSVLRSRTSLDFAVRAGARPRCSMAPA